jgi:hypothetical protein
MYVSIPAVVTLSISVALTTWFIGTRHMDFSKAPTPEEYVQITEQWEKSKPHIFSAPDASAGALNSSNKDLQDVVINRLKKQRDAFPQIKSDQEPSLSEYGTMGTKGAEFLISFARHLESTEHPQHALLAWERVVDMANPNALDRQLAIEAIRRLKADQTPSNTNLNDAIPLTLHIGASVKVKEHLEKALQEAAESINAASGGILSVKTQLSLGKHSGDETKSVPVALWVSKKSKTQQTGSIDTDPVSFMADPADVSELRDKIQSGTYELIRSQLARTTNFSPLPEKPDRAEPDDLIHYHITRLMWREFANSMMNP